MHRNRAGLSPFGPYLPRALLHDDEASARNAEILPDQAAPRLVTDFDLCRHESFRVVPNPYPVDSEHHSMPSSRDMHLRRE